jgi:hypothetical protein
MIEIQDKYANFTISQFNVSKSKHIVQNLMNGVLLALVTRYVNKMDLITIGIQSLWAAKHAQIVPANPNNPSTPILVAANWIAPKSLKLFLAHSMATTLDALAQLPSIGILHQKCVDLTAPQFLTQIQMLIWRILLMTNVYALININT